MLALQNASENTNKSHGRCAGDKAARDLQAR
jgi:hypothetical protein